MIYAVSNISVPLEPNDMLELAQKEKHTIHVFHHTELESDTWKEKHTIHVFHHTELESDTWIFRIGDKYYHPATIEKEKLVIYTALYGDRLTYVRPLPMFLSKVDKEKYPNATHKFKLERI